MQNKRMKRKLVQWSKHGLLSHIRSPLQVVACAMYSSVVQVYSSGDGTKTLRVTAIRFMIWPGWSPSFESASDFSSVLSFYHSHILFIIFIIFIIVHLLMFLSMSVSWNAETRCCHCGEGYALCKSVCNRAALGNLL